MVRFIAIIITTAILIGHLPAAAQLRVLSPGTIAGRIATATNTPLSAVSVQLFQTRDSSRIQSGQSDSTGVFRFTNISPGQYFLRFSSIGYQQLTSPAFTLDSNGIDLGTLALRNTDRQLTAVTVRASKPLYQQRPDGIVVNVADNVMSKGSSALDILERSPGVILNRHDKNITLNGRDGVQVMLNGKLLKMPLDQLMTLLNGTSGNDIEKIELLSNPSAGYDAEGSAGIINIVFKKGRKPGTNGSVSLTAGYGWKEKATAGFNISHNTGNITSYGSYTFTHDRSRGGLYGDGSMNFPPLGGQMNNKFDQTERNTQNDHNLNTGIDLRLDKNMTIGASLLFAHGSDPGINRSRGEYDLPDSTLIFDGNTDRYDRWNNTTASVYLERSGRDGSRINVDLDYLRTTDRNGSDIISTFQDLRNGTPVTTDSLYAPHQKSVGNIRIQVGIVRFDYTRELAKGLKWEMGVKGTLADSRSNSAVQALHNDDWEVSLGTESNMRMKETIAAAYTNFTLQLDSQTNLSAGLRYEYAATRTYDLVADTRVVDRDQGVFFPNISLTHKFSGRSELQLGWSKRISRPSYNDLASFVAYSDPVAINTGNPLLRPSISNSIRLGYNYGNYSFSVTAIHDDHPIARYQLTENAQKNLLIIGPRNVQYMNVLNLQANLPVRITRWWNLTASFVGGWRHFREDFTKYPFETTFFGYSLNLNQTFTLPGRFTLELSGLRNGGGYNGSSRMNGFQSVNAGLKKELANDKGTLQLSVTDIFSQLRYSGTHGYNTEEAFNNVNHWNYNPESHYVPVFRLTYTRSFGRSSDRRSRSNEPGTAEEKDRIRNN